MPKATRKSPLAPRKAPVQRRSAVTVDAMIEAAARILETEGFDGYTTNAVAARAGVSIGSLYQYFPNRDALTAALIERETGFLLAHIGRAAQAQSANDAIECLIDAAVTHQMQRPALARLIDFEERRLPLGERNQRLADILHGVIVAALKRADAPKVAHRAEAAHDVLAIVKGMIDWAGERGELNARALKKRVSRAVFGYLTGAPPQRRRTAAARTAR